MTPNDRGDVKLCESRETITPSPYNALQQLPVDDDDEHHTLPCPGGDDDGGDGDGGASRSGPCQRLRPGAIQGG